MAPIFEMFLILIWIIFPDLVLLVDFYLFVKFIINLIFPVVRLIMYAILSHVHCLINSTANWLGRIVAN